VFRCEGWTLTVRGKKHRWGLVRFAKDPARLKNYDRSVMAEVLALAPKAQWAGRWRAQVEGREDDFRNAHRSGDPLLIYNDGASPSAARRSAAFPAALLMQSSPARRTSRTLPAFTTHRWGISRTRPRARRSMARDRQGDVATYIYPDNLKEAISECGRVINDLIPLVYDTARTIRILGDDEAPRSSASTTRTTRTRLTSRSANTMSWSRPARPIRPSALKRREHDAVRPGGPAGGGGVR
jgi:hypothetical protein